LLAVGADTGLIHAAEALGTPVVMITGPTSRETGANVRHPGSQQLYSNMWCRPCSKNGQRNCIRNEQFCLTNVTSEEVSGAVNRIIAQA
jgi:ADP-heptose:LPS heptosyltransferase